MKLRVLISLLFIISTTFASIHELEHIGHEHDDGKCLVCTVSQNFLSADVNKQDTLLELDLVKEIKTQLRVFSYSLKKTDNHSNAPPFIS